MWNDAKYTDVTQIYIHSVQKRKKNNNTKRILQSETNHYTNTTSTK
jgi:hypothetical protein